MPLAYKHSFRLDQRESDYSYFNFTQNYFVERRCDFDVNADDIRLEGIQLDRRAKNSLAEAAKGKVVDLKNRIHNDYFLLAHRWMPSEIGIPMTSLFNAAQYAQKVKTDDKYIAFDFAL